MRMTNKIMQNNSLYNINNNKILQDKLSTMMSTEKKITRPSDDPVIAIRALRLRTSVSELTQFYEKNAPDAKSWLDVTGKSLTTVTEVLTDMIKQANKGANKDYGPEDLEIVIEQLKSLKNEFYSTGNVDYAGRYIFTGYRTDTTMSFTKEVEEQRKRNPGYPSYEITEQKTIQNFDVINYTNIGGLAGLNKENYKDAAYDPDNPFKKMTEQDVTNGDIFRLRLAYDNLVAPKDGHYGADTLPNWVASNELAGGTLSGTYTDKNGITYEAAGKLDFSALDADPAKAKDLINTGFYTTCCTCDQKYGVNFVTDPNAPAKQEIREANGNMHYMYNVNIDGIASSADLLNRIMDTLSGNPNNHYTNLETDGSTLIVHDNRAGQKAQGGRGQFASSISIDLDVALVIKLPDGTAMNASPVSLDRDPYAMALANPDAVIFVAETGEVLFGKQAYENITKKAGDGEIQFTYEKDQWKDGDLRPEHYFACTATTLGADNLEKTIQYNQEYLNGKKDGQVIEYDVGYNQKIQVNTTADQVFTHGLDRDMDDLERALADLKEMNAIKKDMETVLDGLEEDTAEYKKAQKQYNAANKAYSYLREKIHNMFERTITKVQGYLDDTNVAITDNGTRSQRLSLISNRLMDQRTTFKTLQSENEDADIAEVAVQLTSTELTYEAALMATGKIMQTSLMNYI